MVTDEERRKLLLARGYSAEGKRVRAGPHVVMGGLREQYESGDPALLDVALQAEGAPPQPGVRPAWTKAFG